MIETLGWWSSDGRHAASRDSCAGESPGLPMFLGVLSAVKGETEEALSWFERAYRAGFRDDPRFFRPDPMLDSVREDERFVELFERIETDREEMRRRAFSQEGSTFRDSVRGR